MCADFTPVHPVTDFEKTAKQSFQHHFPDVMITKSLPPLPEHVQACSVGKWNTAEASTFTIMSFAMLLDEENVLSFQGI